MLNLRIIDFHKKLLYSHIHVQAIVCAPFKAMKIDCRGGELIIYSVFI